MSRKARKEISRMIINNYDNLYKAIREAAFAFDATNLPLNTIEMAADAVILKKEDNPPELHQLIEDYNKTIKGFKKACKDYTIKFGTKKVPVIVTRAFIHQLKVGYRKGLK